METPEVYYQMWQEGLADIDRLTKENKTLRQKNDNWLERCEELNTEVVDHQFQNDCRSGSEVCACSEKNGYPCYRHIDHEYRKLFAFNTATTDRAEKAETERDRLREALKEAYESLQTCCLATGSPLDILIFKAINHKEG